MPMPKEQSYFRKDRISTGVRELDVVLEGGYVNPGAVLVLGPSGQEKFAFALHFAFAGIQAGEKVAYVALDMGPHEVEQKASQFGMNLRPHVNDRLIFIDAYSQKLGSSESNRKDMKIPGPESLNDLSLALNEIMDQAAGARMRVVFHSLSTLSIYNPADSVIKFLQVIHGRLKNASATTLWLIDEGMHEKKFITSLESISDQKVVLSNPGSSHQVQFDDVPIPISITTGGAGIEVI